MARVSGADPTALLAELDGLLAALPPLRFGDRCFRCEASCCLRVQAGTYAVLLLPGEMVRLIRDYPQLCGAGRFRRFQGIEVLMGCGAQPTSSVCPINCCGFDCRVFPLYVTLGAAARPEVQLDARCPLAAEVPPGTLGEVQALVDAHPRLFGPYARALAAHYAQVERGGVPYADAAPIADERAYLRAQGFAI
jgi:hypothetical protein